MKDLIFTKAAFIYFYLFIFCISIHCFVVAYNQAFIAYQRHVLLQINMHDHACKMNLCINKHSWDSASWTTSSVQTGFEGAAEWQSPAKLQSLDKHLR